MALNNITFVKGQGGLGRPLPGQDFISSLLFYTATLPSGFTTTNRLKAFFSVADAEAAGITNTFSDETQATGVYTVSNAGATGDQVVIKFQEPTNSVTLATYVKTAADTSTTIFATNVTAAINAGTFTHGYSALNALGVITITVRKGLGVYPNTAVTPLTAVITGTIAGSVTTPFAGGVASKLAVYHYHIAEFFRMQPQGKLWTGFYAVPGVYNFTEIDTIQRATNGEVRQLGVYVDGTAYTAAHTTAIQAICAALDTAKMPLSVLYAGDMSAVSDISTLADLSTLSNPKVSVVISQDGGGLGYQLFKAYAKSITTLGATLGTVALANVQEDIAWVGKFNLSDGNELEAVGFANGTLLSDSTVSDSLLSALDVKRYVFLRKFPNLGGSYFNDSHTAVAQSSDYAYIENNRVIDKAIRGVDKSMLPSLNSPLLLNSDGTLANSTIAFLESQAVVNTDEMVRNGEASAIGVAIDPNQNVATTSTIRVTINIVPVGVAREIIVNIGFKTSL